MTQGLTVLTDEQIKFILESLSLEELEGFRSVLRTTLHQYSTNTNLNGAELHQPERISVHSEATGTTTLWMPSSGPGAHGVKVVTLSGAGSQDPDDTRKVIRPCGAITLFGSEGKPVGFLDASTMTAFRTALASACLLVRRDHVKTLTVFGAGEQAYWHIRLALKLRGNTIKQVNIINRRFSDSCRDILKRFYGTKGSIKVAEGWADTEFGVLTPQYGDYHRLLTEHVLAADVIFCCTPSMVPLFDGEILTSREGRRKGRLIVAIGSYTPEMRELPTEILVQAVKPHEEGHFHFHKHAVEGGVVVVDTLDGALKEAGEIIDAGLSPRQLVEIGELVMIQSIDKNDADTVTADSDENLLAPSSADFERLQVSRGSKSMASVYGSSDEPKGKRSSSSSRPSSRGGSPDSRRKSFTFPMMHKRTSSHAGKEKRDKDNHLAAWLQEGNVIYKSVGLGLMDLAVGIKMVEFAREKGIGTHIAGF